MPTTTFGTLEAEAVGGGLQEMVSAQLDCSGVDTDILLLMHTLRVMHTTHTALVPF